MLIYACAQAIFKNNSIQSDWSTKFHTLEKYYSESWYMLKIIINAYFFSQA